MVDYGCELVREGGNHSWWGNTALNQRSAVPRHREIPDNLVKKICRDLSIPAPNEARGSAAPNGEIISAVSAHRSIWPARSERNSPDQSFWASQSSLAIALSLASAVGAIEVNCPLNERVVSFGV